MKKFRSVIALLLCVLMLCSSLVMPSAAEEVYPESEHKYTEDFYGEWEYTYPEEAEGIFVTFSEDTYTEPGEYFDIFFEPDGDITIGEVIESGENYKVGDYISIFDSKDNLIGVYQGSELAGKTVYIHDRSFKITLTTDSYFNYYGFRVTDVSTEIPRNSYVVRYHMPDGTVEAKLIDDDYISFYDYQYRISGGKAIIGWNLPDGSEVIYGYSINYWWPETGYYYDLYPITTDVSLNPEDVYGFTNSGKYFDVDEDQKYYLTKENYIRLVTSVCVVGGVGPFALPAAVLAAVLSQYPKFESWNGSCIGFANTVCLQKKGILDVVSTQEGATCVRDLEPTPELISLINYYNAQASITLPPKNKGIVPGAPEYQRQLKKLVDTVKAGELVLLEFTLLEEGEFINDYHGVVVTGAYTLDNGITVLLIYDENSSDYSEGFCETMYIYDDYKVLYTGYYPIAQTAFMWTSDFECYKAIDINYDYPGSLFTYYIELIKHVFEILREWYEYYGLKNGLKIKV